MIKEEAVKKKYLTASSFYSIMCKVVCLPGIPAWFGEYRKQMERFVRKSLLFDFYGELLTEKRRAVYRDVVEDDMSYTEAAEIYGISRQGIYDMVKRCDAQLEEYEEKLGLVSRFERARELVTEMMQEETSDSIRKKLEELLEQL